MKTLPRLLAAAALCAAALLPAARAFDTVRLRRRSAGELAADGPANAEGEVTWRALDGGAGAILDVGTPGGTVPVADPFALRLCPVRDLDPSEYALEFAGGIHYCATNPAVIVVHEGVVEGGMYAEGSITVRPVVPGVALAGVEFEIAGSGLTSWEDPRRGRMWRDRLSDDACLCVFKTLRAPAGNVSDGYVTRVAVRAYAGAMRETETDLTRADTVLRDTEGSVPFSRLRRWVKRRYDARLADAWSRHPALASVDLSGHALRLDETHRLEKTPDGALRLYAGPRPAIEVGGWEGVTNGTVAILSYSLSGTNATLEIEAPSAPTVYESPDKRDWRPARVSSLTDLGGGRWRCALVADAAKTLFLRAAVPGEPPRVEINGRVILNGVQYAPEEWTFAVPNGSGGTSNIVKRILVAQ